MGGEREATVPQRETRKAGEKVIGTVRFHESRGEVHFHDDSNNLKAAIKVGKWSQQWDEFKGGTRKKICLIDPNHKTQVVVRRAKQKKKQRDAGATFDVSIRVENVEFSPEFEALDRFTNP